MADTNNKKKQKIWEELLKTTFFILTIGVIVICLPGESKYKYQFELGKPWQYDLLTAQFSFPIYKSQNEIRTERNAILERYTPYYDCDSLAGAKQIDLIKRHLTQAEENLEDPANTKGKRALQQLRRYLSEKMAVIYETGLVNDNDYANMAEKKAALVFITRNNISKSFGLESVYTRQTAMQYLLQNLPDGLTEDLLTQHGVAGYLQPNLFYNAELTNKLKNEELENLSLTSGLVQAGERIIDRGEIVNEQRYKVLCSLRQATEERQEETTSDNWLLRTGQALLILCLIGLFYLYTRMFRKQFYASKRYIVLMLSLITVFVIATSLIIRFSGHEKLVYALPYALLPIIVSTFFDTRTGLYSHIVTVIICSIMVPIPFEFLLLQITAGMVTINSLSDLSQRSQVIRTALIVVFLYGLMYFSYSLTLGDEALDMDWSMFLLFVINGILLLLAYPLIFMIEKLFGFISNVTLIELSNINTPILRRLSETAPGTFQHSLQVSNLAAEIAVKVDANPMLARTGALYHDIGKIKNPAFFTENQTTGVNPHDKLKPEESAAIILKHVTDGIALGREVQLPRSVLQFIYTHHGMNKVRYFYNTWCNNHPDEKPNEALFTYGGPEPNTKEQAIVMICDSVEAASRSLKEYNDENINQLVDRITESLIAEHHLDNAPLTLRQIGEAKSVLKDKLKNIYHTRIAYPELKQS
ncbi:MAG: HDIG domain-containing protein [Paludibacteraceae bacterium]|nr:HDIG domain-containing protein [Paludibacteraceae bacterium]